MEKKYTKPKSKTSAGMYRKCFNYYIALFVASKYVYYFSLGIMQNVYFSICNADPGKCQFICNTSKFYEKNKVID